MANEQQFKLHTKLIATRGVKEYRATIPVLVTKQDTILELGCAWGNTTQLLSQAGHEVIGTDISPACIAYAQRTHPGISFAVLDAFDVRATQSLQKLFTKIYMDLSGLSGYRSLLDVIALLSMYATVLQPEIIVIKSGALKQFAKLCHPWDGAMATHRLWTRADDIHLSADQQLGEMNE